MAPPAQSLGFRRLLELRGDAPQGVPAEHVVPKVQRAQRADRQNLRRGFVLKSNQGAYKCLKAVRHRILCLPVAGLQNQIVVGIERNSISVERQNAQNVSL